MRAGAPGLIIAAPASGSGKTVVTLGLLRCLRDSGVAVAGVKVGPDYIDPAFHAAAGGGTCRTIDRWAMRPATVAGIGGELARNAELAVCEGVMGLFDGAASGEGSTADVAALTGWPVVLVIDARGQGASAAATLRGFAGHRDDVTVAGVVFNRVGSPSHESILRAACAEHLPAIPVLGCLHRDSGLSLPERHLGLVPAGEHPDLESFIAAAAERVAAQVDVAALRRLARPWPVDGTDAQPVLPPPGQRVAVARDAAFGFAYAGVLDGWRRAGAEVAPFSPLADEAPDPAADAVYLPGGYPELHAGRLAAAARFVDGLRRAADRGAVVFGECGGYMAMGAGLTDAEGRHHAMAGLLAVETSFADRALHLGYRRVSLRESGPLGAAGTRFRGHEFHYATVVSEGGGEPLFAVRDSQGADLGASGRRRGVIMGSFVHLIDRSDDG